MSRVGKMPITVPAGATATLSGSELTVKGPLGTLTRKLSDLVVVKQVENNLVVEKATESREANAMWGTTRALVSNMVQGVTKGFEKRLSLVGVGYRAQVQGSKLNMSLGFSHPVIHDMPQGITCTAPSQTEVVISGIDRQVVGQVAAEIRAYRKAEPYKGKGVRYVDEVVRLKETKKK